MATITRDADREESIAAAVGSWGPAVIVNPGGDTSRVQRVTSIPQPSISALSLALSATPADAAGENIVLRWSAVTLEAIRRSTLPPPTVARALAIVHTCIYDAWAAYDSVAAGVILRSFIGSDRLDAQVTIAAGSSPIERGLVPAVDMTLVWRTFSEAADEAGISRRYGGIHFEDGDGAGRALGRQVGTVVWQKAKALFDGARAVEQP